MRGKVRGDEGTGGKGKEGRGRKIRRMRGKESPNQREIKGREEG